MRTDTQRMIEEKILTALNDLDLSVSVESGVTSGVGPPTTDPGVDDLLYTDTTNGMEYKWFSGAWH
jgi:hypothetical protein